MSLIFIDTNVFVYAVDPGYPWKAEAARWVLDHLLATGRGIISTQVIGEFVRATSRGRTDAAQRVRTANEARLLLEEWATVPLTSRIVENALTTWARHQIPYWDAQMCATALDVGCKTILTEDVRATTEGVRYVNPFAEGFTLRDLA